MQDQTEEREKMRSSALIFEVLSLFAPFLAPARIREEDGRERVDRAAA
jgi:hypothetical protein